MTTRAEKAAAAGDGLRVRDILWPQVVSVSPDDTVCDLVAELARFLLRGRIHRALVVEDGVLLGIATPFDILRALFDAPR